MTYGRQSDALAFASAPLVALIAEAVREEASELLPEPLESIDAVRSARVPLGLKSELIQNVYREHGPAFVLDIGSRVDKFRGNAILEALLRSATVDVFLGKWGRLERYGHSAHRTMLERSTEGCWELRHYAMDGSAPGPAHDLLILGILLGLLEIAAAGDLTVELLPGARCVYSKGRRMGSASLQGSTDRWRLIADNRLRGEVDTSEGLHDSSARMAVRTVLKSDPARCWSLPSIARQLGYSARSLQRHLKCEGTSFSQIVRSVRVGEASELLEASTHSVTEIGYLCGFSDAAQFSRDFKSSVGATPTEFRKAVSS